MNRRPLFSLLIFLVLTLWAGCYRSTPEEQAGKAAKEYYDRLVAGDYEAFLCGRVGSDSFPIDYRQQLLQACEQLVRRQEKVHGGITEVALSNAKRDTLLHLTQAFLLLIFCDSTQEEIVVPMIEQDGRWLMR